MGSACSVARDTRVRKDPHAKGPAFSLVFSGVSVELAHLGKRGPWGTGWPVLLGAGPRPRSGLLTGGSLCRYLKEFRTEQCPLLVQHKCTQHPAPTPASTGI